MIAGTLAHLAILIYFSSRPKVTIREDRVDNVPYVLVTPDRGLFFPSVDEIRTRLGDAAAAGGATADEGGVKGEEPMPVIVDMSRVVEMDFTAATVTFFLIMTTTFKTRSFSGSSSALPPDEEVRPASLLLLRPARY